MKKLLLIIIIMLSFVFTACNINSKTDDKFIYEDVAKNYYCRYSYFSQSGIVLTNYEGNNKNIVIPEEIDGYKVIALTTEFINSLIYIGAEKVDIPDTVERIISVGFAFIDSDKLNKAYPDGKILFFEEENGVTYVDGWVMAISNDVKDVVIREGTKGIRDSLALSFGLIHDEEVLIESIYFPGSIKIIPENVFDSSNLKYLKKLTFANGIETIERFAFRKCNSLEEVNIPESVKTIGYEAFPYHLNIETTE